MITIWVPKRLVEVGLYNVAARSPEELAALCENAYRERLAYAAQKIRASGTEIIMLTGPSASGKTTTAHRLAEELERQGTPAQVISLDNFFLGAENYPLLPDGTRDYESPDTLDLPLVNRCLEELCRTGRTEQPIYDFVRECRAERTEPVDLRGGVCIVEGIHALNPALTSLVPKDSVYRVYAGLREEYSLRGRRAISTRDIRLCRRMLRDAATRGHNPEKTLAMWSYVLDGENRYIKGFKNSADFLLDTSFTYELGIIAGLLKSAGQMLSPDSRYLEMWDETARRFEDVAPISAALLPPDSMLREFYA
jgi:uridine kinase